MPPSHSLNGTIIRPSRPEGFCFGHLNWNIWAFCALLCAMLRLSHKLWCQASQAAAGRHSTAHTAAVTGLWAARSTAGFGITPLPAVLACNCIHSMAAPRPRAKEFKDGICRNDSIDWLQAQKSTETPSLHLLRCDPLHSSHFPRKTEDDL